ncbi:unnamed protein product [Leuciscus chuanchicus]
MFRAGGTIEPSGEDPVLYLEKRPLSSPVLLSDGSTTIVAVGVPVDLESKFYLIEACISKDTPFFQYFQYLTHI